MIEGTQLKYVLRESSRRDLHNAHLLYRSRLVEEVRYQVSVFIFCSLFLSSQYFHSKLFSKIQKRIRKRIFGRFFFFYRTVPRRRRLSSRIEQKRLKLKICHEVSVGKEKSSFSSMCVPIALVSSVFEIKRGLSSRIIVKH